MIGSSARYFIGGAVAYVLLLSLPAIAQTPGITESSIVIGSCTALSGPAQKLGLQVVTGASTYFDLVNDAGGINGRKIKLVLHDDSFDPDKTSACFANLQKDNIFAAGFIVGNPTGQKYIALAEQEKIPILGFFSGARQLYPPHNHYSFNVRASYVEEIKEDMTGLQRMGVKKFGVIYPSGPADAMWDVKAAMDKDSPTLVASAEYKRNTLEVGPAIQSVRAALPEAVLLIGPYASVGEIIKRAHQQGWRPIFLTLSFVGAEEFIANSGDDAEGTVITQVVPPFYMTEIAAVAVYRKALKKYYPNAQPGFISMEGFVTAMVLVEGLKRAGRDLTREKFIHSLESIHDLDLGLGPKFKINYSPANHKATTAVYVTVVKAGTAAFFSDLSQAKIAK